MNAEIIFPILCELLLKSTALLAVAGLVCGLWRGASAASRHMVWALALAALLALPLTKLAAPLWTLDWNAPPARTVEPMTALPVVTVRMAPTAALAEKHWSLPPWRDTLTGLWLVGVVALLGYRSLGSLRLLRLRRHSEPLADPRAQALTHAVAVECGLVGVIEVRRAPACRVPQAWGLWRPVVLLPDEAVAWPDSQLAAALRHEIGHLRRRDGLARLLSQLACAVYWMNPLVWMAARRLRLAQEQACDDLVLRSGANAPDYADLLVQVSRGLGANRLLRRQVLAMAHPSALEARVRAIVDERRNRVPLGRGVLAVGMVVTAMLLVACGAAQVQEKDNAEKNLANRYGRFPQTLSLPETVAGDSGPQILVEAKIIELPVKKTLDLPRKFLLDAEETKKFLQKIGAMEDVDMLGAPRVATLPGQEAKIQVGREVPLGKDGSKTAMAGVSIELLPKLQNLGMINLTSTLTLRDLLPGAQEPFTEQSFNVRQINSTVSLASGQTVVIGNAPENAKGRSLLLLITATLVNGGGEKPVPPSKPAAAEEKAKRLVAPKLEFQEAPLEDVVNYLVDLSRQLDPDRKGVNILLQMTPGAKSPVVTLNLHNIPLLDALRYTADLTGLKVVVGENVIVLQSPALALSAGVSAPPRPAAPGGAAAEKARQLVVRLLQFREAPLKDVVDYLVEQSRQLDPDKKGINILLQAPPGAKPPTITLELRNIPLLEALGFIAQIAECELAADDYTLRLVPKKTK
jgi:beta-lactamase regulating signal transducer with metallopeptidase domain